MNKIKLDINLIKYMSLFQSITRTSVKDCIDSSERIIFIVKQNQISKAIGRNGENVKMLENALNRKIKIVEFNPEIEQFVRNTIYPNKTKEIKKEGKIVIITPIDLHTRGMIIGKNAVNLRGYESIIKRYFDIEEIKVI